MTDPFADLAYVERSAPLGSQTTAKVGGTARWHASVSAIDELEAVLERWRPTGVPFLVLGWGSNVIVSDAGFDGLVVRLGGSFTAIEFTDDAVVAGAAVRLPMLARAAVAEGRTGLEFFVGVPGTVGGAVRQNAGCHGSETIDWLIDAEIVDAVSGSRNWRTPEQLELGYRHSNVAATEIVVRARFAYEKGDASAAKSTMAEISRWRKEHQPGGTFNAGSVFKNPPGDSAGRIIDALGLKGFAVGGAHVSHRHANFFEADDTATASDVHALVRAVRDRVKHETGVELEPEIQFVGEFAS